MISYLFDLWEDLRLFWVQRPWKRTCRTRFNPAKQMTATQARRLACGGSLRGNA